MISLSLSPGDLDLLILSCDYFASKANYSQYPSLHRILSERLSSQLPREPILFAASFIGLRDYLQQNRHTNPLPLPFPEDPVWLYYALLYHGPNLNLKPTAIPVYTNLLTKLKDLFPHDNLQPAAAG